MSVETEDIEVKKGAYGYRLSFTLYDDDGEPRICTGYTVDLRYWVPGASEATSVDLTWTDESAGTCYYDVQDGDFDTAGRYKYEIELEKDGTKDPAKTGNLYVVDRPTSDAS
jgi:hypothetical protein